MHRTWGGCRIKIVPSWERAAEGHISLLSRENLDEGLLHRFEFVLQFPSGGGRSGESALVSSEWCYWYTILTTFTLKGNQKKLRRQDICNYINDWECYEIDFYHCLAGYFSARGGTLKNANFLLPHPLKGSGAAAKMTRILQDLSSKIPSIPSNIDGTSRGYSNNGSLCNVSFM